MGIDEAAGIYDEPKITPLVLPNFSDELKKHSGKKEKITWDKEVDEKGFMESVLPESILDEAKRLVYADRANFYGSPEDDFQKTLDYWKTHLDHLAIKRFSGSYDELKTIQKFLSSLDVGVVPVFMMFLKISREENRHKRDNMVDIAGYADCYYRLYEEKK